MKHIIERFLIGNPYGLLGKIYSVEGNQNGRYTLWDRIRYRQITGKSIIKK